MTLLTLLLLILLSGFNFGFMGLRLVDGNYPFAAVHAAIGVFALYHAGKMFLEWATSNLED